MRDREKLEERAFEILRSDMQYIDLSDAEIKNEISKQSNIELHTFIAEED